jgi:hypothetical protein
MTTVLTPGSLGSEMANASFEDRRLGRRLGIIAEELGRSPSSSFPQVFDDDADLEAAYRFLGNARVTPELILSGHRDAVRGRMHDTECSLVVHDTTKFVYRNNGARRGLGRVMSAGQAFFGHFALVLADDGTRRPLGIGGVKFWARGEDRAEVPERARWYELVNEMHHRMHSAPMIHVMDREADDYALLRSLVEQKHRFVIRSKTDRVTAASSNGDAGKLSASLANLETMIERDASLSKRTALGKNPKAVQAHPARGSRIAKLSVAATTVAIARPSNRSKEEPPSLDLNVVRVWEPEPPLGEDPVEWILYTSEPIATEHDVLRTVDRYRARWTIEVFFKALKTGCAMEERQLMDYESLCNAAAIFAPIAAMLLMLRSELDRDPEGPASNIVSARQLDVLRAWGKRPIPPIATVRSVVYAIGGMGGHVKHARTPPGWQTLARGLERLEFLCQSALDGELQWGRDQR